jgi:hypothetical protein
METSSIRNVVFSSIYKFWRWTRSRNPVILGVRELKCILYEHIISVYINKNVTVRLFKVLTLRKFFTDCFAILTQRCIRIRTCFYIHFIRYTLYFYVLFSLYTFYTSFWKTAPSKRRKGTIVSETTNEMSDVLHVRRRRLKTPTLTSSDRSTPDQVYLYWCLQYSAVITKDRELLVWLSFVHHQQPHTCFVVKNSAIYWT